MSSDIAELTESVKQAGYSAGFDLVGIAPAGAVPNAARFDEWLAAGYAAGMEYLARTADVRTDIRRKYPWAASIVSLGMRYPSTRPSGGISGHIARYALGDDYHRALKEPMVCVEKKIHEFVTSAGSPSPRTVRIVDAGPLMEKHVAAGAGLGWIGRNTLLINEHAGSYLLLSEIVTDVEMVSAVPVADRCGDCRRCIDACPTKALVAPGVLDARRCIAYHTIESRESIPAKMEERLSGNLFGCDICQEVCPWNGMPSSSVPAFPAFQPRSRYTAVGLDEMKGMPQDRWKELFAGSAILRADPEKFRRTADVLLRHRQDTR